MSFRFPTSFTNKDVTTNTSSVDNPPKNSALSSFSVFGKKIVTQLSAFGNAITQRVNALLAKMNSIVDSLRGRAHIINPQHQQPTHAEEVSLDDTAKKTDALARVSSNISQPVLPQPTPVPTHISQPIIPETTIVPTQAIQTNNNEPVYAPFQIIPSSISSNEDTQPISQSLPIPDSHVNLVENQDQPVAEIIISVQVEESLAAKIGRLDAQVHNLVGSINEKLTNVKKIYLKETHHKDHVEFKKHLIEALSMCVDFSVADTNEQQYVGKIQKICGELNWIFQVQPDDFQHTAFTELFSTLQANHRNLVTLITELNS